MLQFEGQYKYIREPVSKECEKAGALYPERKDAIPQYTTTCCQTGEKDGKYSLYCYLLLDRDL